MNTTWIKNLPTPIAVIGLGKSGLSALALLKAIGFQDDQLISYDDKDLVATCKGAQEILERKPKTLVVSPGVPLKTVWIQSLISSGITLTSEISLAASLLTKEKLIGVTGSVGKSTVVSILAEGAKNEDENFFVGGNLGFPFCDYALSILQNKPRAKWVVLELSSYQLENCAGLSLDFSAITFLSPNHLERYDNLEHYYKTKLDITLITKNICVFNESSADAAKYSDQASVKKAFVSAAKSLTASERKSIFLMGSHNHDNFAVAKKLAELAGWSAPSIAKMAGFAGLPHRLENVGIFGGVQFINDSKATSMDSILVATKDCLENLPASQKLFLLLGGKDKNLPWDQLSVLKSDSRLEFVFFGACGKLAHDFSTLDGSIFTSLELALEHCFKTATLDDVVLLSPGGTSLDEFKNFEERGAFFKNRIRLNYR